MLKRATPSFDHPPFATLPVRSIRVGANGRSLAVHIHGELSDRSLPIVCLAGYARNMLDFAALPEAINRHPGTGLSFVLIDLPGRGRSSRLPKRQEYTTPFDARCVLEVLDALDIARAIVVGEGHGGQVAMLVALERPSAIAGTVLVDAGPVTDSRGLVRVRNNFQYLSDLRGERAIRAAMRKITAADYPGETEARLDALSDRGYAITGKGRLAPLFDPRLIGQLDQFDVDDALEPQWPLFDCLNHAPLMLVRTQLSDQLHRATFEEMQRRRPDAATLTISGQGSPALLESGEEIEALATFLGPLCIPMSDDADDVA